MPELHPEVLIPAAEIAQRVQSLGAAITEDYPKNEPLLLIGVLRGSWIFLADLARAIKRPVEIDFLHTSSYGSGTKSSGEVKLVQDLSTCVEGMHVIVVEDIVDTGITLDYLLRVLHQRHPKSLAIASFLDKSSRRQRPVDIRYCGFTVPNRFVVGYGLDANGEFRNLPDLCAIDEGESEH